MTKTIRESYPALFIFGDEKIEQLDAEAEAPASFDLRIKSAWPFIVRAILAFHTSLSPREQAAIDPEDIVQELWLKLRERDHKWNFVRGRYISFVGVVVSNELLKLRRKGKTVSPPGNAKSRLCEYERRDETGDLDEGERGTMRCLKAVLSDQTNISSSDRHGEADAPDTQIIRREEASAAIRAVVEGIGALEPEEAAVLGQALGLWGQDIQTPSQIAADRKRHVRSIKAMVQTAQAKFRVRLMAKVAAGQLDLPIGDAT